MFRLPAHAGMVYCAAPMTYGGVRKVVRMRDAHIELRNTVTHVVKRVPLLLTSKVLATLIGAGTAVYLWPVYMVRDVYGTEIYMRGKDPAEYGIEEMRDEIDYWMI